MELEYKANDLNRSSVYSNYLKQHLPLFIAGEMYTGTALAGGAARAYFVDESIKDFDIFFIKNKSFTFKENVAYVRNVMKKHQFELTYECPQGFLYTYEKTLWGYATNPYNSESTTIKVQLISEKEFDSVEQLLDSFDFTATQFALDDMGKVWHTDVGLQDVINKILRINRITYPVATLNRIVKYAKRGYNISEASRKFVDIIHDEAIDTHLFKLRQDSIFSNDAMRTYID